MRFINRKTLALAGAAAALVTVGSAGTAVAGNLIGSADIQDESIRSADIMNGKVRLHDLSSKTVASLQGHDGVAGVNGKNGVDGKNGKDGKDGVSNLIVGAGYAGLGAHDYWAPGAYGETIETCPAGQYAIGGGFSQDASTGTDGKYDLGGKANVQITVSAPYFAGDYTPVDDAGNFRADQWVVRGFNHSAQQVDVRAWVICADAS